MRLIATCFYFELLGPIINGKSEGYVAEGELWSRWSPFMMLTKNRPYMLSIPTILGRNARTRCISSGASSALLCYQKADHRIEGCSARAPTTGNDQGHDNRLRL